MIDDVAEANPDLACVLQLMFRSIFGANFAKEENSYEKIHSIWNIGSESFRITSGVVGDGSNWWTGVSGVSG
jgi:hypothetical protein